MKLSILMAVYNERTVVERCMAQVLAAPLPEGLQRELIVVDDRSSDGTYAILERLAAAHPEIRLFRHPANRGKGAAIRTAIEKASGDFSLVQDADLEYDPAEYPKLLRPLIEGRADAVFGSRYLAGEQIRVLPFWHSLINKFLTLASNVFCNLNVTDMETCYKVFRTDLLKSIPIRSDRFGFEPEITMKCAKRRFRIYEVPISYHGRTYDEGKKIGWKDGVKALGVIVKFWLIDDLYTESYGRRILNNLSGTPQYVSWLAQVLRPYLGDTALEVGGGIGNIAGRLMARRKFYLVTERDALHLHALRNRFLRTPNVSVVAADPAQPHELAALPADFETVLCLNVLEYLDDPPATLAALRDRLKPGGALIVLVPQAPRLYGSLDRAMGHRRRFEKPQLTRDLESLGLRIERTISLNRAGAAAWWISGTVLRRARIGKPLLKAFDKTVFLWKLCDRFLPWPALSLIVIASRPAADSATP